MSPLERTARLEEVVDLLDEVAMLFALDEGAVWNHFAEGDPGYRRVEFLAKIAMAIGMLQNQVKYENDDMMGDAAEKRNLIQ